MTGLLVDSSILIAVLREPPGSAVSVDLAAAAVERGPLLTTEPVAMEVLAGARGPEVAMVTSLLDSMISLTVDTGLDFRAAASLFRDARSNGYMVRGLNDCLIAAVAIRHGCTVLHRDRDFEVLSNVSPLVSERWS